MTSFSSFRCSGQLYNNRKLSASHDTCCRDPLGRYCITNMSKKDSSCLLLRLFREQENNSWLFITEVNFTEVVKLLTNHYAREALVAGENHWKASANNQGVILLLSLTD